MPRIARVVGEGLPHHITQRGNYRQKVLEKREDFEKYLSLLEEQSRKYETRIISYCIMNNHVHFIAIPEKSDSLANTFKYVHMKYSQYVNKKKGMSGHLWQSRFFSSVIDKDYLSVAMRYVERNPVRAKMVKRAVEWEWSSAIQHCGYKSKSMMVENITSLTGMRETEWEKYLEEKEDSEVLEKLRKNTSTGRPIGNEGFVDMLEKKLKRVLKIKPAGRLLKKR
ncbi:MAG: transposase [Candidatus Firestonebacteria bacterium]